jgi:hypothetical protein
MDSATREIQASQEEITDRLIDAYLQCEDEQQYEINEETIDYIQYRLSSISSPINTTIIFYPWVCSVKIILPTSSNLQQRTPNDYLASSLRKHRKVF